MPSGLLWLVKGLPEQDSAGQRWDTIPSSSQNSFEANAVLNKVSDRNTVSSHNRVGAPPSFDAESSLHYHSSLYSKTASIAMKAVRLVRAAHQRDLIDRETTCSCCLDEMEIDCENKQEVIITGCGHCFHRTCFLNIERATFTQKAWVPCPICRETVTYVAAKTKFAGEEPHFCDSNPKEGSEELLDLFKEHAWMATVLRKLVANPDYAVMNIAILRMKHAANPPAVPKDLVERGYKLLGYTVLEDAPVESLPETSRVVRRRSSWIRQTFSAVRQWLRS